MDDLDNDAKKGLHSSGCSTSKTSHASNGEGRCNKGSVDNELNTVLEKSKMVTTESNAKDAATYAAEAEEVSWHYESGLLNAELEACKEQNEILSARLLKFDSRQAELTKKLDRKDQELMKAKEEILRLEEEKKLKSDNRQSELTKKLDRKDQELARAKAEILRLQEENEVSEEQVKKMDESAAASAKNLEKKLNEVKKTEKERLKKFFQKKFDDEKKAYEETKTRLEAMISDEKEKN